MRGWLWRSAASCGGGLAMAAIIAVACTAIPEPLDLAPIADAGAEDAPVALGDGGYDGSCEAFEGAKSLGLGGNRLAGDAPGSVVDFFLTASQSEVSGEIFKMGIHAAGYPDEVRGRVLSFDTGVNADLATCVHCMVVQRGCDMTGMGCAPGFYMPRSGEAVAVQMNEAAGEPFLIELYGVDLVRVEIGEGLHTTRVSGDEDCIYVYRMILGSPTIESTFPCELGQHCEIAATAGSRHPE